MSIYTVREVSGNAKAHPHLEARGLNARSVPMTSLDPLAIADYPQIAYHLYTKLLPAFMLANKNNSTIPTTRPGYKLVEKAENCIPIQWPPLTVKFKEALSAEESETMKSLGAGIIANKKAVDIGYTFAGNLVDKDLLTKIYKHKKKAVTTNPTPTGSVNLKAYQEMFRALSLITWFLKTQTYPAFVGPVANDDDSGGSYDSIDGLMLAKRKGNFGDRLIGLKKRRSDDDDLDDMEEDEGEVNCMGLEALWIGEGEDSIPKAKPSEQPPHLYGPYTSVPTLPGLLFPYFPEMVENDYNYVSAVVKEYFLESLGDTRDEILSVYKDFKASMGSVAATESGRILQHLFLGVSLAIRAQARMYPILDGRRYLGFTLHGWYFTVSIDGYKHRPMFNEELVKQVRTVDEHAVAIASILQRLASLKLIDGKKKPTKTFLQNAKPEVSSNPRKLAEFIRKFDLEDSEEIEEIEKLATRLSFPQRYWTFTVENILRAVDFLIAGSFPPVDTPMFPRGGTLTSATPTISIFALFGECGFSFKTAGGKPLKVPVDQSSDTVLKPYKGKNQKEVKPNPTFILSKKSLGLCVEDWKLFYGDHLFLNKETRDAAFRAIRFGGPYGVSFWKGLIERIGPIDVIASGSTLRADLVSLGDDAVEEGDDDLLDFL